MEEEKKKEDIKKTVEKLLMLNDAGRTIIKIQTDALYARQMLDEKQTA